MVPFSLHSVKSSNRKILSSVQQGPFPAPTSAQITTSQLDFSPNTALINSQSISNENTYDQLVLPTIGSMT